MSCFKPITAYQAEPGAPLLFAKDEWGKTARGGGYQWLQIACGQCIGCRLERSKDWALRCIHEAQMHKKKCFVTLTYDDKHLPPDRSLDYRHYQLFMKRLRKSAWQGMNQENSECRADRHKGKFGTDNAVIRFYMGGEYGDQYGRPHYHAILFGVDFGDKVYHGKTPAGSKIYVSATLDKLWGKGYASIGDVTFESAAYVARYIMAKKTGDEEKHYYNIIDPETGEIHKRKKEFNNMSRRPGIGAAWMEKFHSDIYTTGKAVVRNAKTNPPRYYDKIYKNIDELALEGIQYARLVEAMAQAHDNTPERLRVKEEVQKARIRSLQRRIK